MPEGFVTCHDGHVLRQALRDQKSIERIAMMQWHPEKTQRMFLLERQYGSLKVSNPAVHIERIEIRLPRPSLIAISASETVLTSRM